VIAHRRASRHGLWKSPNPVTSTPRRAPFPMSGHCPGFPGRFPICARRTATPSKSVRYTLAGCPCPNPISEGFPDFSGDFRFEDQPILVREHAFRAARPVCCVVWISLSSMSWVSVLRPDRRSVARSSDQRPLQALLNPDDNQPRLRQMAQCLRRCQDDERVAQSAHPSLRHCRDWLRELALQDASVSPGAALARSGCAICKPRNLGPASRAPRSLNYGR